MPQNVEAPWAPGLEACLALHVGPQWPELANTCWGCCQHVWALCHALGCTLPGCFGVLTLFGPHLGISVCHLGFWRFFAVFGQPACQLSCSVAPKGGWPSKLSAFADAPTQSGHPTPNMARCGMGAKTPFSFKKGVEILNYQAINHCGVDCYPTDPF